MVPRAGLDGCGKYRPHWDLIPGPPNPLSYPGLSDEWIPAFYRNLMPSSSRLAARDLPTVRREVTSHFGASCVSDSCVPAVLCTWTCAVAKEQAES